MEAKDRTDTGLTRRAVQSRAGRVAIKAAGWVVAIPALCALVVIGGAAPIYLLLPEAAPVAGDGTVPGTLASTVSSGSAVDDSTAQAPRQIALAGAGTTADQDETAGPSTSAEAIVDAGPPAEEPAESVETVDEAADPASVAEAAEDLAVTVVPTARPRRPVAETSGVSTSERRTASLQPATRDLPAAESRPVKRQQASRRTKRFVTIRPVALRSRPGGGREVAVLGRGAEVLAGPCTDWCEVSSGGVTGWIHPSFLSASAPRARGLRPAPLTINPYDDEPLVMRESRRYERRYDRRYEQRRDAAPDWMLDDDRPIEIYDYDGRR